MADTYDILVIGAGPGGYVTAIRAAQLGFKAGVVDREHLGGICLNWGCIPTKALLRSAEIYHYMEHAKNYGLSAEKIGFDTAARPRVLPGIEPDKKLIWTYFEAMVPDKMPKSLLVIGSGAIGIEFASFYRTMGAEVTVVEVLPQVLPVEDAEIAGIARKRFEKQGIKILTGAKVTKVEKGADSITATVEDGKGATQKITAERLISAVGVVGNVENLGLEKLGVTIERGIVATDGLGRTSVPG